MRQLIGLLLGALLSLSAAAEPHAVRIMNATVQAPAPGEDSAPLQFSVLTSGGGRIVGVSSPVAGAVEFQKITKEGDTTKIQRIEFIALRAGQMENLANRGERVMLLHLKHPLKAGDKVPFTIDVGYREKNGVAIVK